jgi:HlyD family secretion protein
MAQRNLLRKGVQWGKYLFLLAVFTGIVYWVRFSPLSVIGHTVTRGAVTSEVMGTGTLEARVQTVVSSKIAGRISEMLVDQGDEVQAGQVLLRLDDQELKQQVEIARSALAAANASVERVEAEAVRAQAVLSQVQADHQSGIKAHCQSFDISATDIDKSVQTLAVAEADLVKFKASVMEAKKNLISGPEHTRLSSRPSWGYGDQGPIQRPYRSSGQRTRRHRGSGHFHLHANLHGRTMGQRVGR